LNNRLTFAAIFLICGVLLGFGYYLQYARNLDPCPLCMVQRLFFFALAVVALIAAIHNAERLGTRIYGATIMLLSSGGALTAGRQVWLQHLPPERVPECGPGLEFMLRAYPLLETLEMLLRGSGECAEVVWTFLGLSIPEWALVWFSLSIAAAIAMLIASRRHPET